MEYSAEPEPLRLRHRARVWLTVRASWLVERMGRYDYVRRSRHDEAFNGQRFRQAMFRELAELVPFVAIIETGTFRGTTTEYFRRTMPVPIHSFEANPRHYGFARAYLRSLPNVYLHRCDSRLGLECLAAARSLPPGPVFFYLDAHGFGELPLAQEIDLVFRHWPQAVIMIDDFAVPDDPGYGFDDYGRGRALTLDYLAANGIVPRALWFPTCAARDETGARRGCVVFTGAPDLVQRLDGAHTLRRWADHRGSATDQPVRARSGAAKTSERPSPP